MGMFDSIRNKKNPMNDPDTRETIQRIATEHGMSIEEATTHYMRTKDS